jgi:hypothetical protein
LFITGEVKIGLKAETIGKDDLNPSEKFDYRLISGIRFLLFSYDTNPYHLSLKRN